MYAEITFDCHSIKFNVVFYYTTQTTFNLIKLIYVNKYLHYEKFIVSSTAFNTGKSYIRLTFFIFSTENVRVLNTRTARICL